MTTEELAAYKDAFHKAQMRLAHWDKCVRQSLCAREVAQMMVDDAFVALKKAEIELAKEEGLQ